MGEETFRAQLDVNVSLQLPPSFDPFEKFFFRWSYPQELAYEGMVFHVLSVGIYLF